MQLSLYSDYACRVLIFLATSTSERSSIQEIAKAFGISENHLVKVVHRMGQLGFLINSRGRTLTSWNVLASLPIPVPSLKFAA
jgi:Rrf2 family nitric oxide-sensitive transcriptional repressor